MKLTADIINVAFEAHANLIKEMESQEDWVFTNPEIESKINSFVNKFKEVIKKKDIKKENILILMAYVYTGNMLSLLSEINEHEKEYFNDLIEVVNEINQDSNSYDQKNKMSEIFAERLMVIYRMQMIPKIFSKERIQNVNDILNELNN